MTGVLIAVVGPSGAGKDAVIGRVCDHYAGDERIVFPRRVITRPTGEGEDHVPTSEGEFAAIERSGGFAVQWHAHGLRYGIPREVTDAVGGGCVAVVNVSRAALVTAHEAFPRVLAVRVTVPDDVRRERILSRGRENMVEARARLQRPDPAPGQAVDLEIVNDGPLARAGQTLIAFVQTALASVTDAGAERRRLLK